MQSLNIFWFRRDLRLHDNAGLYHALKTGRPVLPVFIFDTEILEKLENKADARVHFIHQTIGEIKKLLNDLGSDLLVYYGKPEEVWKTILNTYKVESIFTNRDYENYAKQRDGKIKSLAEAVGTTFHAFKDQVIFDQDEVLKDDGTPYTVFTPYSKKWKAKLTSFYASSYPCEKYFSNFLRTDTFTELISLEQMGFQKSNLQFPPTSVSQELIKAYNKNRDFPAIEGTSHLGLHFRFGTISIREKVRKAHPLNETFLNELIWREFYMMITDHFPHLGEGKSFKPAYDLIQWRNNPEEFEKWCNGQTGYPIVDAGMRELNATGYMHNRVRMIVASFLTKHLLIDWRWGEAYFAKHLLDFDFSANNGGWQWAAGSGTDAAPYFRVFNPALQTLKFDTQLTYVKKWVPELNTLYYPKPIVDHTLARNRCLEAYKVALQSVG